MIVDALAAHEQADATARRLAPPGIAPEFLRDALWHRILVGGDVPTDAEISRYLQRCVEQREPVSGRREHEIAEQPVEGYRAADVTVRIDRLGASRYGARLVGSEQVLFRSRTRKGIHRQVEARASRRCSTAWPPSRPRGRPTSPCLSRRTFESALADGRASLVQVLRELLGEVTPA